MFVIGFVPQPRFFGRIGQKAAFDDNRRAVQLFHQIDGAVCLFSLAMIQWVAAVDQALLYLLGQRLALHIPCRVEHLCAMVLCVTEFIQVNAQKHR